jgi:hypothetical protein
VAADEQRDRGRGTGALLERLDLVELPGVGEELARGEALEDVHALVHPLAALLPRHAEGVEVLGPGGEPDAEAEAAAGEVRQGRGLLGHEYRRAHGQLQHERRQAQRRRVREEVRAQDHRLDELLAVEELAVPGVGVGVLAVGALRVDQGVGHGHRRVAGGLGGLGQGCVVGGLGHRLGVGEPHKP